MLKVLLLATVLLMLAFAGFAIKMFFDRKAEFKGGNCSSTSPELESRGISCGCGGSCSTVE